MGKIKFSKKMMYSTLAAIGLMGSTGAIVGSVVNNNNLQTSQQISNLNSQIQDNNNTINLYNSSSSTNSINQTNNSSTNTTNADLYSNEFLNDFNNYVGGTDYTTNISKVREGTNELSSVNDTNYDYKGDLTTNSLLQTTKDKNEINLESQYSNKSNLYSTITNAITQYKSDWLTDLNNNLDALNKRVQNNYEITSITPIAQYAWINWWYRGWTGLAGDKVWYLYDTFDDRYSVRGTSNDMNNNYVMRDPNSALAGYMTYTNNIYNSETSWYFSANAGDSEGGNWSCDCNNVVGSSDSKYQPGDYGLKTKYANNYATYGDSTSTPNTLHWSDYKNIIGQDEAKNGFTFTIDPYYDTDSGLDSDDSGLGYTGGKVKYTDTKGDLNMDDFNNNLGFTKDHYLNGQEKKSFPSSPGWSGDWITTSDGKHEIQTNVPAILNSYYDLTPNGFGETKFNNFPSTVTVNTFPNMVDGDKQIINNGFYGLWQHSTIYTVDNRYYDIYRGLLQWQLSKAQDFSIDNNNYSLSLNGTNIFDENGNLSTNWNIDNSNYYIQPDIDSNNNYIYNNVKIVDSNGYMQELENDPEFQDVAKLYKTDQLQNIMQQLNSVKSNIDVTNLNDVKITQNIQPFGTSSPFSATKIVLPNQFDTNYQNFDVTQPNNVYGSNTSYVFNNFLPFLSSQIVIDPQSAESNYTNPNNTTNGLYTTTPNSIKFKLSENYAQLLSIMNLYNTYKNDVNSIDLNSDFLGDGGNSQRDVAIKNFVSLFNNLSFNENDSTAIGQLINAIHSKDTKTIDAILFGTGITNNNDDSNKADQPIFDPNLANNNTNDANNRQTILNLIQKVFNDSNTNSLIDGSGNFTSDAVQYLSLLPILTKEAMSNLDIYANVSFGDNTTNNQGSSTKIWAAPGDSDSFPNGGFTDIALDFIDQNPNGVDTNNNDSQINISNIHFDYKDNSTIKGTNDAYTDNMNFLNNGVNSNLNYTLSEFNNYYPNNNAVTVDNSTNTIIYKVHYNPSFGVNTPNSSDLENQGVPINNEEDTTGLLASQYKTNEQDSIINTAVQSFFTPAYTETKNYGVVVLNKGSSDAGNYKTIVETIANSNNLVLTPDDSTGTFYALVTLDHTENLFANPYGNSTKTVVDGKMWYVADVSSGETTKIYLVKMNAAKKEVNLSDIQFGAYQGDSSKVTWGFDDTTNYYYGASLNDNNSYSTILMNGSTPLTNQTIKINLNENNYIELNDDISSADSNSQIYKNFENNINAFFYKYYGVNVKSYSITTSDNTWTINITLNN